MREVFSIEQAAKDLGLPRRSLYNYVKAGVIPVERMTGDRVVMLFQQVQAVRDVLCKYGREGVRNGLAFTAA